MAKSIFLWVGVLFSAHSLLAQSSYSAFEINSKNLEEGVSIEISLPKNYNDTTTYPVLYLFDGQWLFNHALSIRTDLTERNGAPKALDFIIVGIETPNEKRWGWSLDGLDKLIGFLGEELIPEIESRYKVSDERLLAGWEAMGGSVVRTLVKQPDLFDGYIAASPTPLYGKYFPQFEADHQNIKAFMERRDVDEKFLFIGEADEEYPAQYGIARLVELLQELHPEQINWHHKLLPGVTHPMSPYYTLRAALEEYYKYHGPLEFAATEEFKSLGGLTYFDAFYQERAELMGLDDQLEAKHFTRRNLSLAAIGENDITTFHELMVAFKSHDFLEKSFVPHLDAYVQFYLRHEMADEAMNIATFMMKKYENNAMVLNAMGDVYFTMSKMKEARTHYKRAVEVATENEDWKLEVYQKDLQKLK